MSEDPKGAQGGAEDLTFEDAFRELDRLVSALESGRGNLEDALTSYERAVRLTRICRQKLDGAARRIEMIKGINDSDELVVEELDENAMLAPVETAGRQVRATNAKAAPPSGNPAYPDGEDQARNARSRSARQVEPKNGRSRFAAPNDSERRSQPYFDALDEPPF